jgi:hypothetical protein
MSVYCANGVHGDRYVQSSSTTATTLDPNKGVPSGAFAEGSVRLGVPKDCGDPVIRISGDTSGNGVNVRVS